MESLKDIQYDILIFFHTCLKENHSREYYRVIGIDRYFSVEGFLLLEFLLDYLEPFFILDGWLKPFIV